MKCYNYVVKNHINHDIIASGIGMILDLQTIVPIELLSVLELYEDEKGVVSLDVQTGDITYSINKIL